MHIPHSNGMVQILEAFCFFCFLNPSEPTEPQLVWSVSRPIKTGGMTKFGPNIVWTLSSLFGLLVWANPPDSFEGVWWADCRREQHADLSYGTSRAYFCSGWSSISTSPMWSNSSAELQAENVKGTNIALVGSAPANGMWYRTISIQMLIVKFQKGLATNCDVWSVLGFWCSRLRKMAVLMWSLHSRSYVGLSDFKAPWVQQLSSSASSRCRLQDFLSMQQMGLTLNHRAGNQEVIEEELMMIVE